MLYWSLTSQWPFVSSTIRRAKVFWATIRAGPVEVHQARRPTGVTPASGPRPPGRPRRLALPAQEQQRRPVGVEDQDVGLAVAVDVERPRSRRGPP